LKRLKVLREVTFLPQTRIHRRDGRNQKLLDEGGWWGEDTSEKGLTGYARNGSGGKTSTQLLKTPEKKSRSKKKKNTDDDEKEKGGGELIG